MRETAYEQLDNAGNEMKWNADTRLVVLCGAMGELGMVDKSPEQIVDSTERWLNELGIQLADGIFVLSAFIETSLQDRDNPDDFKIYLDRVVQEFKEMEAEDKKPVKEIERVPVDITIPDAIDDLREYLARDGPDKTKKLGSVHQMFAAQPHDGVGVRVDLINSLPRPALFVGAWQDGRLLASKTVKFGELDKQPIHLPCGLYEFLISFPPKKKG